MSKNNATNRSTYKLVVYGFQLLYLAFLNLCYFLLIKSFCYNVLVSFDFSVIKQLFWLFTPSTTYHLLVRTLGHIGRSYENPSFNSTTFYEKHALGTEHFLLFWVVNTL